MGGGGGGGSGGMGISGSGGGTGSAPPLKPQAWFRLNYISNLDEWVSKLQGEGGSVAGTPKPKRSKRHKEGAPVAAPGGRGRSRQA